MITKFDIGQRVWIFDNDGLREGFVHSISIKSFGGIYYRLYKGPIGNGKYEIGEREERHVFASKEEAVESLK